MQKTLRKNFTNLTRPNFKIDSSTICYICQLRHEELEKGRAFTFEDLRCSCHSYMFYDLNIFSYLLPLLLEDFITNTNEWIEHNWLIDNLFDSMSNHTLIDSGIYNTKQKSIILDVLENIKEQYYMEHFEVWDFEQDKLVYFYEEERIYKKVVYTIRCWRKNERYNNMEK